MERELINVNQASRLTGLTPQTLYRLARRGRLPKYRVLGRALRFDRSDIMALVHAQGEELVRKTAAHARRMNARANGQLVRGRE